VLAEACALDGLTLRATASAAGHPAGAEVLARSTERTCEGADPWTQYHGQQNGQRDRDADDGIDDPTITRAFKPTHSPVTLGPRCPTGKEESSKKGTSTCRSSPAAGGSDWIGTGRSGGFRVFRCEPDGKKAFDGLQLEKNQVLHDAAAGVVR
jgi:hypothetical protein